jgi:hypothetical protein
MRIIFPIFALVFLQGISWSRTWTDASGKSIDAEIVSADEKSVTIEKAGKEFTIPLEKLSEKDREFVTEWVEEQEGEEAPQTAGSTKKGTADTFDGKPLVKGGKVNLYHYDYSAEVLEEVKKTKMTDTGFRVAIAVPADFDPAKPQKVFIVNAAGNNQQQLTSGNTGMMGSYAKACTDAGWVCLAYDTNIGRSKHYYDIIGTFNMLDDVWPDLKKWQFAVGGFSGGAKGSFDTGAFLIRNEHIVIGALLIGCNEDRSESCKKRHRAPSSGYRNMKVFMSTGDTDHYVSASSVKSVISSLKSNGLRNVRSEIFKGGHTIHQPHITDALKWFESPEK